MKHIAAALALSAAAATALAKLPAPSDEAKAKAAEAAAKTAWSGKVDAYLLCKSQDRLAAGYHAKTKAKPPASAASVPACADPGPFVYTPPVAASAPAAAVAAASAPAKKP